MEAVQQIAGECLLYLAMASAIAAIAILAPRIGGRGIHRERERNLKRLRSRNKHLEEPLSGRIGE